MLMDSVKIGDRLEVQLKREKSLGKSYVSQVEETFGDNQVKIHMPISYGQLVMLPINDNYSVLFFTEKGMISFDASVEKYEEVDGFKYAILRLTSAGERIQRREFFRFNCLLQFKFGLLPDNNSIDEYSISGSTNFQGIIKDLGGGGIRFVSNDDVAENMRISCVILLEDDLLILVAKVLHKQYFPKSNYKYQYRVQFTGVTKGDQELIVKYIFNQQRKILRNVKGETL